MIFIQMRRTIMKMNSGNKSEFILLMLKKPLNTELKAFLFIIYCVAFIIALVISISFFLE